MDDYTDLAHDQHLQDQHEEAEADYWRGQLMGEVEAQTLAAIHAWVTKHEGPLSNLKRTHTRIQFCAGLATMADYKVDVDREEVRLERLLSIITPPNGHPSWGNGKKPNNLFGHVTRLESDKLATFLEDPGNKVGHAIRGMQLTPLGILYAHKHGAVTFEEVVEYWRWENTGRTQPTSNIWYLRARGGNVVEKTYQMRTPGSGQWSSLRRLKRGQTALDADDAEDADGMKGSELGSALSAVHREDAVKCWGLLKDEDRRRLIEDVLVRVAVPGFLVSDIADKIEALETSRAQVNQLIDYWGKGNPMGPDEHGDVDVRLTESEAKKVVSELVCRSMWYSIRHVMDYRINDPDLADTSVGRFGSTSNKWTLAQAMSLTQAATATFDSMQRTANLVDVTLAPLREAGAKITVNPDGTIKFPDFRATRRPAVDQPTQDSPE